MPSYVTPKKNTEFIFYISLASQANVKLFQVNPTLAAGDVKVSVDGGAENNISSLPVVAPAGSTRIKITLSAAEMNGDNIQVSFIDVAGDEWASKMINVQTTETQIDNLVRATTPANTLDIDSDGNVTASNIASGGGNLNAAADSFTLTTGTVVSGTIDNTKATDQVYHQLEDAGGTLDAYYEFNIGSFGSPSLINIVGRLNSANDNLTVYAWNWGGSAWESLGSYAGQGSAIDTDRSFVLFSNHVGTATDIGKVRIRFEGTGLTGADLYNDRIVVEYALVSQTTGYENGAVWLDTNDGTAGTTVDYNGIASRPVDSIADALTLANSIGLKKIKIASGSNVTLGDNMDGFVLEGESWDLDLGNQSCSGTHFTGADVSGTATGANEIHFFNCEIESATLPDFDMEDCRVEGPITKGNAGTWQAHLYNCCSHLGGTTPPIIDCDVDAGANTILMCNWAGGIEFQGLNAGDTVNIAGAGSYTINADCSGGNIYVAGAFTETDNASGSVTVSDDARYETQQISDSLKLAPAAGSPAAGSVNKHLDDIEERTTNLPDDPADASVVAAGQATILGAIGALVDLTAADVWGYVGGRALTDKVGFALSTAGIKAIWDQITSVLTTAGSIGKFIIDRLDVVLSTRSSSLELSTHDADIKALEPHGSPMRGTDGANTVTPPTVTEITADIDSNSSQLALVLADTNSIRAKTNNLPEVPKKNTAFDNPYQFFMEDANGEGLEGLSVAGVKYLDGTKSAISAAITEVSDGWYKITPVAGDVNGDHAAHVFSAVGAKNTIVEFWTTT